MRDALFAGLQDALGARAGYMVTPGERPLGFSPLQLRSDEALAGLRPPPHLRDPSNSLSLSRPATSDGCPRRRRGAAPEPVHAACSAARAVRRARSAARYQRLGPPPRPAGRSWGVRDASKPSGSPKNKVQAATGRQTPDFKMGEWYVAHARDEIRQKSAQYNLRVRDSSVSDLADLRMRRGSPRRAQGPDPPGPQLAQLSKSLHRSSQRVRSLAGLSDGDRQPSKKALDLGWLGDMARKSMCAPQEEAGSGDEGSAASDVSPGRTPMAG
mmetsp:Transcript_135741/g.307122  ORF Transcript_135741/g.307122 Transcript_135741/m.307122 type:complete len:270 (+) Transcript_135741:43-852(+)